MRLGLGRPAEDGQAPTAEEPSETGAPAEPTASDAPGATGSPEGFNAPGVPAQPASSDEDATDAAATSAASVTPVDEAAPDDEAAPGAPEDETGPAFVAPVDEAAPGAPEDETGPAFVAPADEDPSVTLADEEDEDVPVPEAAPADEVVVTDEVVVADEDALAAPVDGAAFAAPLDDEVAPASADPLGDPGARAASTAPGGWSPTGSLLEESAGDLDGPLLGDVAELRTGWQQILAGFVDDPREAVADAADLVEHTAQALVGALHQRQRLLRATWDRGRSVDGVGFPASGSATDADGDQSAAGDVPDTEQLRLLIQRYRTLFNQMCRP
jgi:hypothetical protein